MSAADTSHVDVLYVGSHAEVIEGALAAFDGDDQITTLTTVETAADAVQHLESESVDCLVCDGELPETDGRSFLDTVRKRWPSLPVLLLVADSTDLVERLPAATTDFVVRRPDVEQDDAIATRIRALLETDDPDESADLSQVQHEVLREFATDMLFVVDGETVTYQSPSTDRILKSDGDGLVGERFADVVHPDDWAAVSDALASVRDGDHEVTDTVEFRLRHADGSWAWIEAVLSDPEAGVLDGIVFVARDISERKAREERLDRMESIIRAVPDEVYTLDTEGVITSVIPPVDDDVSTAGYEPEELVGEDVSVVMDEEDIETGERAIRELVTSEERDRTSFEMDLVTEDGERIPHENHVALLEGDEPGEVEGTVGVLRDISERKAKERELAEEREFIEQSLDALDELFYLVDPDGSLVRWNESVETVSGYTEAEVEGMDALDFFQGEDRERVFAAIQETMETGAALVEANYVTKDGEEIPYELTGAKLTDADGNLLGLVGIGRDITERKQRERELEQAETVFQNAQDGVFLIDVTENGRFEIRRVNEAYEDITGLSNAEIAGQSPRELLGDETGTKVEARFKECVDRQAPLDYEEEFDVPDLPSHWHTSIAPVVVDGEVEQLVGATRNITDRKEREQELELKDRVIEEAPIGISLVEPTDSGFPIVFVNEHFTELTGYDETEARGLEWSVMDGPETDEADAQRMQRAMREGETETAEIVVYRKDGTPFWCRTTLSPLRSDDGEVTHIAGFAQDVSERKEYEKDIERRLDEFSDVFAEELREPIEAAQASLAEARTEPAEEPIEEAEQWLDRVEQLLDDLATVHSFATSSREFAESTLESPRED